MPAPISFPDFLDHLSDLGRATREDAAMQARIAGIVGGLRALDGVSRETLAAFVAEHPDAVPVLATCAGLTQEQFKNQLTRLFGTQGWTTLARTRGEELVRVLDEHFALVERVREQMAREWSFADVLLERHLWSRRPAAGAVGQGRRVEDEVEAVARRLGVSFQARTRFTGRGGATAPCDLALPGGGDAAQVVVAMKGFNSTGSKLTDAVREIEEMAGVRRPDQYVYAVVDGIGWRSRKADLRRIHDLWERRSIDGLYTLAHLDRLQADLAAACRRLGLLPDRDP